LSQPFFGKEWFARFTQVKLVMFTFNKVQIPSVINTISIRCHEDSRNGIKRTCVYSSKTWNPTSLAMEAKES
jgi:hypothetical protein